MNKIIFLFFSLSKGGGKCNLKRASAIIKAVFSVTRRLDFLPYLAFYNNKNLLISIK